MSININSAETVSTSTQSTLPDHTFVLFGGTGDLAHRKLYPALYSLHQSRALPSNCRIVGMARRQLNDTTYREMVKQSIVEFGRTEIQPGEDLENFLQQFFYFRMDVTEPQNFCDLASLLKRLEQERGAQQQNRLFYLAMAPEFFEPVAKNLKACELTKVNGWRRLIIEKPFGRDYASAEQLNQQLRLVFEENEIYRIDHYLGKEMVQNIEVIRFANSIFEPVWNNRSIANVQITSSETVGVEDRGSYYESSGALRDMIQNHMLQMVMMIAMEPPSRLQNEAIRDEKVKVLRSLRRYSVEEVAKHFVRGQYQAGKVQGKLVPGYRDEPKVASESQTETFVAARLFVDNFRWADVPFYLRTGKRMATKATEIVIQFRDLPKNLYFNQSGHLNPNLLIIRVSPTEGISLLLNAKHPGSNDETVIPVDMEFSNETSNSPESYERLLHDAMLGDATFFTRWDEVALAWKFVDPIAAAFTSPAGPVLEFYESGFYGPEGADRLLRENGHFWWPSYNKPNKTAAQATIREIRL